MPNEVRRFTCYKCKETFEVILAFDAEKEYDEVYRENTPQHIRELKEFDIDKRHTLCDDCFKLFCAWAIQNPETFSPGQISYFRGYIEEGDEDGQNVYTSPETH